MDRRFKRLAVVVLFGFIACVPAFTADEWKENLEQQLQSKFVVTKRSAMGSVKTPGSVLVVQIEGLRVDRPKAVMTATTIQDGKVAKMGGGGFLEGTAGKALKRGDRLYLYSIGVKDDAINLLVATVDTFDVTDHGTTTSTPYTGAVHFAFADEYLPTAAPDDVIKTISAVLRDEAEAAAEPAKTVKLGQSQEEVVAVMGKPEKIIDLGEKVVYVYKDMKVIFRDGKVADVE